MSILIAECPSVVVDPIIQVKDKYNLQKSKSTSKKQNIRMMKCTKVVMIKTSISTTISPKTELMAKKDQKYFPISTLHTPNKP